VSSIQDNEAPNVITETRFRTLMQSGYLAEVYCQSSAFNKSAVWYGVWVIRIIDEDRTFMKLLVPARSMSDKHDEIRIREFKTANGLISFLASMPMYRFKKAGFQHTRCLLSFWPRMRADKTSRF
jgi:hypothetical protein